MTTYIFNKVQININILKIQKFFKNKLKTIAQQLFINISVLNTEIPLVFPNFFPCFSNLFRFLKVRIFESILSLM